MISSFMLLISPEQFVETIMIRFIVLGDKRFNYHGNLQNVLTKKYFVISMTS